MNIGRLTDKQSRPWSQTKIGIGRCLLRRRKAEVGDGARDDAGENLRMVFRLTVTPIKNIELRRTELPENLSGKSEIKDRNAPVMLPPGA
jgi:hypothetical protein